MFRMFFRTRRPFKRTNLPSLGLLEWPQKGTKITKNGLRAGRDVLLKIDVQGAATIHSKIPDAIFIFLVPGSLEELAQRLADRQTETEPQLVRRLSDAREELAQQYWYDYVIVNRQGHLKEAADLLHAIMLAEHARNRPRNIDV